MALVATMMLVKGGLDILGGLSMQSGTDKQLEAQKKILDTRQKFNEKQLQKAYNLSYSNLMRRYGIMRNDQVKQATQGIKDTNTQISARVGNVNLNDSSFKGDINAEMDAMLVNNINALLQSQENDVNTLLNQNFVNKVQLEQNYFNSLNSIESATQQQKQVGFSQMLNGAFALYSGIDQKVADIESSRVGTGTVSKDVIDIQNFGGGI